MSSIPTMADAVAQVAAAWDDLKVGGSHGGDCDCFGPGDSCSKHLNLKIKRKGSMGTAVQFLKDTNARTERKRLLAAQVRKDTNEIISELLNNSEYAKETRDCLLSLMDRTDRASRTDTEDKAS